MIKLDSGELDILNKVEMITSTHYGENEEGFIESGNLVVALEELVNMYENLLEEKKEVEDKFIQFDKEVQYEYGE